MGEEQYVNRNQHRADLVDLRSELKEDIAGLRQDIAVVSKSVEHLTTLVMTLQSRMDQQFSELRLTQNRQLWAMIALIAVVIVSGLVRQFFFTGGSGTITP